jgi:hypothetical protein
MKALNYQSFVEQFGEEANYSALQNLVTPIVSPGLEPPR